jgi:hypothetical protein
VDHALELLSASFAGINPLRRYAVKRLEDAKDEELLSYLLQLVQALRYEKGFLSDEQIMASQTVHLPAGLPSNTSHDECQHGSCALCGAGATNDRAGSASQETESYA